MALNDLCSKSKIISVDAINNIYIYICVTVKVLNQIAYKIIKMCRYCI